MEEDELLYEFKQGPYDVLEFEVRTKDEKAVIEINGGDLGRLPIENLETIDELRNALDEIERVIEERQRKKEDL